MKRTTCALFRLRIAMRRTVSTTLLCLVMSTTAFGQGTRPSDGIDWKLFFNQMFALELRKEIKSDAEYQLALKKFTAYTPKTFNETLNNVLEANTTEEAYNRKIAIYDSDENYKTISNLDFNKSVPATLRSLPAINQYLTQIKTLGSRPISKGENFFDSAEAQNFVEALSTSKSGKQDVAMVMIPGYAAHTIKFEIFPEIMEDINKHWDRPTSRPILNEGNGLDITYQGYKDFYGQHLERHRDFDILHPAGWEMGNTIGLNAETSDLMAEWLKNLPPEYAQKKLIFLSYSKGAGIVLEMLQRHPDLRSRVIGIVTYAGVIQGTHIARFGRKEIQALLGNRTIDEFIQKIRARGTGQSIQDLAPFLSALDLSFLKLPQIKHILEIYGVDTSKLDEQSDRILGGREVKEFLDGIIDLAPDVRTAWNLRNLDNNLVDPKTFIFNLTAVTDISSWATRMAGNNTKQRDLTLLTPAFRSNDQINWPNFSLDAWFLYLSSLNGFKLAPGGLYDAQVELQHTKTPWLDKSPLTSTLTIEEIEKLWEAEDLHSKLVANGITTLEGFKTSPRSSLIRYENRSNICAYDLGEIKGHHWSLFHQAFRAPAEVSSEYAVWDFPRKAFMRAVLQTIGLYNLVAQSPN